MILSIANVLQTAELQALQAGLAKAKFADGRSTASGAAARAKSNQQVEGTDPALPEFQKTVIAALLRNEAFAGFALPLRLMPPMFNRYESGMTYGDHIDRPVMQGQIPVRTDLAMTLFLSDPKDYDGGELIISSDFGAQKIKLPAGSMVLYPASTLHRVDPVTRGARLAAVSWVQSMVRSAEQRQLLAELGQIRRWMEKQDPNARQGLQLQKVRGQLMRWWSEV